MMVNLLLAFGLAGPLPADAALWSRMEALGIPEGDRVIAFAGDAAIAELAAEATRGASGAEARARRLFDALLALKRSGAIVADRDNAPKARPPKTAVELLALARAEPKGSANREAGCYELSALYVAAARSIGLDAVGVERDQSTGTGQIGHILAGVRFVPGGRLTLYDLQNETQGSPSRTRELSDAELAAHHYNHLAVAAFLRGDLGAARAAIDRALLLAPESPSLLNNRATVVAGAGEPLIAVADAAHAVELAPDVPLYRYQLGRLYLVTGELDRAVETLTGALALRPRYGLARRDLGWAHLLANNPTAAEAQLRQAIAEERDTPEVQLYFGLFLLAEGRREEARAAAAAGLALPGGDREAVLALAALAGGDAPASAAASARLAQVLSSVAAARAVAGAGKMER